MYTFKASVTPLRLTIYLCTGSLKPRRSSHLRSVFIFVSFLFYFRECGKGRSSRLVYRNMYCAGRKSIYMYIHTSTENVTQLYLIPGHHQSASAGRDKGRGSCPCSPLGAPRPATWLPPPPHAASPGPRSTGS